MSADNDRDDTSVSHSGNRKPSMEIRYRLADNLRRYRTYRGYTQEDLAKVSGLHRALCQSHRAGNCEHYTCQSRGTHDRPPMWRRRVASTTVLATAVSVNVSGS